MSSSNKFNSIIFNLAGGAVLLTTVGYMVVSYFTTPAILPCTSRFPAGVRFTFDGSDGKPLTPIELQGRSGSREWGLLKNARVVSVPGSGGVLEVKLAATDDDEKPTQNGVGFTWSRHELEKASSACLSYNVYLPQRFAFKELGYLPGIFGAADLSQLDEIEAQDRFAARMGWSQAGDVGIDVRTPTSGGYWLTSDQKWLWPTGRWVKVEQEIRLNTQGHANGFLRLWIDGQLAIDRGKLELRTNQHSGMTGVISDIGYARTLSDPAALRVSPFILQWQ